MCRGSFSLGGSEATNPPIGKALAADAFKGKVGTVCIVDTKADAVGITEVELCKVARKVLLATMLVDPAHTALEDTEEAFDGVGVGRAVGSADVFVLRMVHPYVLGEVLTGATICLVVVGKKAALAINAGEEIAANVVGSE